MVKWISQPESPTSVYEAALRFTPVILERLLLEICSNHTKSQFQAISADDKHFIDVFARSCDSPHDEKTSKSLKRSLSPTNSSVCV